MEWKLSNVQDSTKNIIEVPKRWVHLKYYDAFNLLFRIENALRVFVYIILKNKFHDEWHSKNITIEDSGNNSTISSIAKKRMQQAQSFGYLGHPIFSPIMYLTSGELTNLIFDDNYWKFFADYFKGKKEIIKNKLEEIGTIRNSLAHFRPVKDDDVTSIKHNAKHALMGVEDFLFEALNQRDIVPTNTEEKWYKLFRNLNNDLCTFGFLQSRDSNWIRINLYYKCTILNRNLWYDTFIDYNVLSIDSSSILELFPKITNRVTFAFENIPYVKMPDDFNLSFYKHVHFIFARKSFDESPDELHLAFSDLIKMVLEESQLIQQDNMARGKLISSVNTWASGTKNEEAINWDIYTGNIKTPIKDDNPSEYWGNFPGYINDFISATTVYPWMPENVSLYEPPF